MYPNNLTVEYIKANDAFWVTTEGSKLQEQKVLSISRRNCSLSSAKSAPRRR